MKYILTVDKQFIKVYNKNELEQAVDDQVNSLLDEVDGVIKGNEKKAELFRLNNEAFNEYEIIKHLKKGYDFLKDNDLIGGDINGTSKI